MCGLLGEEAGSEFLLHVRRDENATEAVFRFGASMDADAGSSGDLTEDGQQAFELGRLCDCDAVDERGDEVVGVFEGVADVVFAFGREACALVEIMGCPV